MRARHSRRNPRADFSHGAPNEPAVALAPATAAASGSSQVGVAQ